MQIPQHHGACSQLNRATLKYNSGQIRLQQQGPWWFLPLVVEWMLYLSAATLFRLCLTWLSEKVVPSSSQRCARESTTELHTQNKPVSNDFNSIPHGIQTEACGCLKGGTCLLWVEMYSQEIMWLKMFLPDVNLRCYSGFSDYNQEGVQ